MTIVKLWTEIVSIFGKTVKLAATQPAIETNIFFLSSLHGDAWRCLDKAGKLHVEHVKYFKISSYHSNCLVHVLIFFYFFLRLYNVQTKCNQCTSEKKKSTHKIRKTQIWAWMWAGMHLNVKIFDAVCWRWSFIWHQAQTHTINSNWKKK